MKKIMKNRKGFTLVELVAVVGIIAILSLIALPRFANVSKSANHATFKSNINAIKTGITLFQAENGGALPPDEAALAPYLEKIPSKMKDSPKGAEYTYTGGAAANLVANGSACEFPSGVAAADKTVTWLP